MPTIKELKAYFNANKQGTKYQYASSLSSWKKADWVKATDYIKSKKGNTTTEEEKQRVGRPCARKEKINKEKKSKKVKIKIMEKPKKVKIKIMEKPKKVKIKIMKKPSKSLKQLEKKSKKLFKKILTPQEKARLDFERLQQEKAVNRAVALVRRDRRQMKREAKAVATARKTLKQISDKKRAKKKAIEATQRGISSMKSRKRRAAVKRAIFKNRQQRIENTIAGKRARGPLTQPRIFGTYAQIARGMPLI